MRSRRFPVSADFVGGLNLIDVEFYDCPGVVRAWRAYLDNLSGPVSMGDQDNQRVGEIRNKLRTNILSEMTKVLRLPIPDLDIFGGGYGPQGWIDNETEASLARRFLADIAAGRRSIPIELRPPPAL